MNYGSLWERLVRGVRWSWVDPRYRAALPEDLDASVMTLESRDRLHAKQGRSTARVRFHPGSGPAVTVYLKRHFRLPWLSGLAALLHPGGRHSPGASEWVHLERAREIGVPVPDVVATGERIGPWTSLQSYLMVAELTGSRELNVAIPDLYASMDPGSFAALKRRIVVRMAEITATLHAARAFHKDLYLCHFYLDEERLRAAPGEIRLALIDLHRLGVHALWPDRWRWKDLGQLLFSTEGIDGIDRRDVLRFWKHYRRRVRMARPAWQARMIQMKAMRYREHNLKHG
ncbi:Lipopolysaccharide core heptose(I) kinase RfaP [Aquisphaera giovannonii]|uniref:Lipopolysaccharide core heptose(I) kinase RfaP n=1 Tax=Aquisphaera giovannonii TaxID=406548 RepID=A0A5B9WBH0_9BACT|nr:lipopolysaccharide kinase InaA family protein [Aquisphaera giovannonii]QEH37361.1 Lipopolysaccharide core heptose(I) kinase RfaP [Aquisphaera giovannonii]